MAVSAAHHLRERNQRNEIVSKIVLKIVDGYVRNSSLRLVWVRWIVLRQKSRESMYEKYYFREDLKCIKLSYVWFAKWYLDLSIRVDVDILSKRCKKGVNDRGDQPKNYNKSFECMIEARVPRYDNVFVPVDLKFTLALLKTPEWFITILWDFILPIFLDVKVHFEGLW